MKRLMKILLGLTIGAAIAVLFAPKSGRELRQRLIGGATSRLLPAAPVEFPEPEGERFWEADAATAVAEVPVEGSRVTEPPTEAAYEEPQIVVEPAALEEAVIVEEPSEGPTDEPTATEQSGSEEVVTHDEAVAAGPEIADAVVDEHVIASEEAVVVADVAAPAVLESVTVEETGSEDLRARIEETRAAVETDIAEPFAPAVAEVIVEEAEVVREPAAEEPVVEATAPSTEDTGVEGAPAEEAEYEAPAEEPRAWEIPYEEDASHEAEPQSAEAPVVAMEVVEPVVDEEAAAAEPAVAEIAEESVAEAPPADEPVAEAPPVRESGAIDQAEMRRRIEETRARLKAKAFDAMMSGESALLSRDSGEKPVPTGEDVKLDGELESTIDESLSQEEY
jgi:hypothetical protein